MSAGRGRHSSRGISIGRNQYFYRFFRVMGVCDVICNSEDRPGPIHSYATKLKMKDPAAQDRPVCQQPAQQLERGHHELTAR